MIMTRRTIIKGVALIGVTPLASSSAMAEPAISHVLMVPPSGRGKGVGYVVPKNNGLRSPASLDIRSDPLRG